jgi:hypothetical protein
MVGHLSNSVIILEPPSCLQNESPCRTTEISGGCKPSAGSELFGSHHLTMDVAMLGLYGLTSSILSLGNTTKSMSSIGITPRST